jgi:hypothetical protein
MGFTTGFVGFPPVLYLLRPVLTCSQAGRLHPDLGRALPHRLAPPEEPRDTGGPPPPTARTPR